MQGWRYTFVVQNTAPQVTFMKDTAVFDMPALFDSIDEVREHVDNPRFMKLMQQVYNDGGYELWDMQTRASVS